MENGDHATQCLVTDAVYAPAVEAADSKEATTGTPGTKDGQASVQVSMEPLKRQLCCVIRIDHNHVQTSARWLYLLSLSPVFRNTP